MSDTSRNEQNNPYSKYHRWPVLLFSKPDSNMATGLMCSSQVKGREGLYICGWRMLLGGVFQCCQYILKSEIYVSFCPLFFQAVVPFRSFTRSSSIRKYSGSMSLTSPTYIHSVNPLNSVTPLKNGRSDLDTQLNHATSGYLSENSSNTGKAGNVKQLRFS